MSTQNKKLSEYALNIPESEYHRRTSLSYSILARYEREGGFSSLPQNYYDLWAPTEQTEALLFGSAFDTLVTRGREAFDKEFISMDGPALSDKIRMVIDELVKKGVEWEDTDGIVKVLDELQFYPNWKTPTRIYKLIENNSEDYYRKAKKASLNNLTVLPSGMKEKIMKCYDNLLGNELTKNLLFDDLDGRERFFQLQFESRLDDVTYKIMCDMILVNHNSKTIDIFDLKTTGKESSDFRKSYLDWGYHIQSWLYRMVLENALIGTEYEDYTIRNFSFIVVSKVNDTPLVWLDDSELELERPRLRNPLTIGKEIQESYTVVVDENLNETLRRKDVPDRVDPSSFNLIAFY